MEEIENEIDYRLLYETQLKWNKEQTQEWAKLLIEKGIDLNEKMNIDENNNQNNQNHNNNDIDNNQNDQICICVMRQRCFLCSSTSFDSCKFGKKFYNFFFNKNL